MTQSPPDTPRGAATTCCFRRQEKYVLISLTPARRHEPRQGEIDFDRIGDPRLNLRRFYGMRWMRLRICAEL